jgi:hypothetical protein
VDLKAKLADQPEELVGLYEDVLTHTFIIDLMLAHKQNNCPLLVTAFSG